MPAPTPSAVRTPPNTSGFGRVVFSDIVSPIALTLDSGVWYPTKTL
jgi:hypothetical protein